MPKKRQRSLADPSLLSPRVEDDKQLFKVVVETPKGSRNKYAFDPRNRVFELKKVLPAGMVFPYDFGFLPSTKGGDGDPLDVLVLMDEPALEEFFINYHDLSDERFRVIAIKGPNAARKLIKSGMK